MRHARRFPPAGLRRRLIEDAAFAPRRCTARWRPLPGFLVIGAQRAGTTSLLDALARHPDLAVAPIKEVHYFDAHWDRGLDWYRAHFPLGDRLAGEATPYYLFHPAAPERVRATLPGARLIALLRDPVERALSQYRHEVRLGFEDAPTFEAAWAREAGRLAGEEQRLLADPTAFSFAHNHHSYVARGDYARQLAAWLACFPRAQLLVLWSERLFADPAAELGRVQDFLGVPRRDLGDFRHLNAAPGEACPPAVRARLVEHFAPLRRELDALLGPEAGGGAPAGDRAGR